MEKISKNGITYWTDRGAIYSVDPPTAHFNMSAWCMLVPPYKPENILFVGCAGNTVPKLVKIIYGDIAMTGVDNQPANPIEGMKIFEMDALDFLKQCTDIFDCVVIDIFEGATLPRIAREQEFADLIAKVCRRTIVLHTAGENIEFFQKHFSIFHEKTIHNVKIFYMKKLDCQDDFKIPSDI